MKKINNYLLLFIFTGLSLIIGLVETLAGKLIDDDWHEVYVDSQLNHGQGVRKK